ncbi:MAG: hypothetical protein BA873_04560 [Desulfobulbaceae bacterium C00003063]|nr:MAG: hypothetical protein BA873_04560 [Desulfobulbaceae bacterium C00003063]
MLADILPGLLMVPSIQSARVKWEIFTTCRTETAPFVSCMTLARRFLDSFPNHEIVFILYRECSISRFS